jgi:ADP-ribose pyrophosphatase YjhB (NUDIX family)
MIQLHYLQLIILKKLLFREKETFSNLRPDEAIENNKLNFHLDSLISHGLISKIDTYYILTAQGKEYANTIDTDKTKVQKQGKISTIQCCYKKEDNKYYFLLYTRKKQPFFNSQGYPSGKVPWGESTEHSSQRELFEETGLKGNPQLFMIEHHLVSDPNNVLLEDKYFYFYKYFQPQGELKPNNEGLFEWVAEDQITKYLTKPFESTESILNIKEIVKKQSTKLTFHELQYQSASF